MSAKETIDELCLRHQLSDTTKESANEKYEHISRHHSFAFANKQSKSILSAVCLYLSAFEDHKPVTITQICHTIGVNINEFGKVYNQVIKEFPKLKNESISIEELVEPTLNGCHFDDDERPELIQRVIELLRVVRDCWLIEGRSPVHIIYGTTYLSWKSLKPWIRSKVKLTEFCRLHSIEYKHTTVERVGEIFDVLKRLGQRIPGKEGFKFTKQNIAIYINDILTYNSSLLFDLNNHFKTTATASEPSTHWTNTLKRRRKPAPTAPEAMAASADQQKDEEFSDTEINAYIRSKTEVKKIKKIKKIMGNDDSNDDRRHDQKDHESLYSKYIKVDGLDD